MEVIIQRAIGGKHIFRENIPGIPGFLSQFLHPLCAGFDQRVQFLGGLAKDRHGKGIPLGFVFDLAQRVDQLPIHGVAVTHIAVGIGHRYTQSIIGRNHGLGAVCSRLHGLDLLCHGLGEGFCRNIHQLGGIHILLELIRCNARHGGFGEDGVSVGRTFHGHVYQCLSRSNSGGRNGGEGRSYGNARSLADSAQLLKLVPGIIALFASVLNLVTEVIGLLFRIVELSGGSVQGIIVLLKFPLHVIEGGFSVV